MQYQIIETQPFKLFGMDAVQIVGWDPEKFLEHTDRIIEKGNDKPAVYGIPEWRAIISKLIIIAL